MMYTIKYHEVTKNEIKALQLVQCYRSNNDQENPGSQNNVHY